MPLSPRALEPLLRLALVPGVGPARLAVLLGTFGSAERVLGAATAEIARLRGMGPGLVGRLAAAKEPAAAGRARACLERLQRVGAVALTPDDLAYPAGFRVLPDPPFLLFAIGELALLERPAVGVVGTREPTPYGLTAAALLAAGLARAGLGVVSGMAKGIDAAAHAAALEAGGSSVGVLGQGIDGIYPAENRSLFERMRSEGLLVSEFPPGEEPRAGNFPRRNRLIAALARGVLVVEMAARSGAQHTVNYALEQGKEVFAVPGPIGSPVSEGTNQLLKDGARLVTRVEDILEELGGIGVAGSRPPASLLPAPESAAPLPVLAPAEAHLRDVLGREPCHVDELSARTGLSPAETLGALLALELHGLVEALPGKRYRLA